MTLFFSPYFRSILPHYRWCLLIPLLLNTNHPRSQPTFLLRFQKTWQLWHLAVRSVQRFYWKWVFTVSIVWNDVHLPGSPVSWIWAWWWPRINVNIKVCSPSTDWAYIDGSVQERHNFIANALELCLSCTNTLIWEHSDNSASNFTPFCFHPVRQYCELLTGPLKVKIDLTVRQPCPLFLQHYFTGTGATLKGMGKPIKWCRKSWDYISML